MMLATMVTLYESTHQFEPLMPSEAAQQPLLAQAHDLARAALQLTGTPVPAELRRLLRGMNSTTTGSTPSSPTSAKT